MAKDKPAADAPVDDLPGVPKGPDVDPSFHVYEFDEAPADAPASDS